MQYYEKSFVEWPIFWLLASFQILFLSLTVTTFFSNYFYIIFYKELQGSTDSSLELTFLLDPSHIYILYRVWVLETPFVLVIGFINDLHVITTITYYTVTYLHNFQSVYTKLLSLPSVVFTYLQHGSHTSLT
jgi:hypothetical protein